MKERYCGGSHNRKGDDSLGFGFIHYALIRNMRPKNILCVGSWKGFIPAVCALACKNEGRGRVDFVDAGYDGRVKEEKGKSWGGAGIWKKATADYWKPLGVERYIELFLMTIEDFCVCNEKNTYQYIYLDADHRYEGVKAHFELLWPRLDNGGLFLFHDLIQAKECIWGEFGVLKFINEIKDNMKLEFLSISRSAGLGIVRKL